MTSSAASATSAHSWKVSLQRSGTAAESALDRHLAAGIIGSTPSRNVVVQPCPAVFEQDYYLLLWQPGTSPGEVFRIAPDLVQLVSVVQRPEYPIRALLQLSALPAWQSGEADEPQPRVRSVPELEALLTAPDDTDWLKDIPAATVDRPTTTITSTAFAEPAGYSFSICTWLKICDPQPPA